MNSAFLNISIHFTVHLFRLWIPNSARHRRWTPTIHRGRARRTISAGSWFGQWSPDPPSSATAALPAPDRWRVTWRPPLSRMAGPGDPRRTSPRPSARHLETSGRPNGGVGRPYPNQRNKSERKENVCQPQLCSSPRRGHCRALPGGSAVASPSRRSPTEGVMFDGLVWGSFPGWSWLGDRVLKCLPAEQTTFHPGW